MRPAKVIDDDELGGLFATVPFKTLIVAVSGGADSLALLHLLLRWRALVTGRGGTPPDMVAATVDHGLRAESDAEATWIGSAARSLGLTHEILVWTGPKPASRIQAAARAARYRLLADLARGYPVPAIVTAHTRDDQAETVLMRLARGSGVDGLAGMPAVQKLSGLLDDAGPGATDVPVWRPLLRTPKARLLATLTDRRVSWLEDPSNRNSAFERVRLRAIAPALESAGLTSAQITLSARRLERARAALEDMTEDLWARQVDVHHGAFASIERVELDRLPAELRIRLLRRVLQAFGGAAGLVPLEKAERLSARLQQTRLAGTTIAGCRIEWRRNDSLIAWRESGRLGLPRLQLRPGTSAIWDHRFSVTVPAGPAHDWRVVAFDPVLATENMRDQLARAGIPKRIARTLPSLWCDGNLVCLPRLAPGKSPPTGQQTAICLPSITFLGSSSQ